MNEPTQQLTPEEIEKNWTKFRTLCEKLGDRTDAVLKMLDVVGERLALCPASSKKHFHNAFPGGLVDHSLRVLGNAMKLKTAFDLKIPKESLIIAALFHDFGKMGDHEQDNYIPQTDGWKVEKYGEEYTYNKDLPFMTVPLRGVFLFQHFGITLNHDEMLAIILNDGQYTVENEAYKLKEPVLADVIHMADLIYTKQEKGIWPR
jgi:hypothetical protein